MTINGAIMELVMLCEHPMMPNYFKPSIQKVIETISEAELFEPKTEPQTDGIIFKGNLKEGDYKLIKTTDGWVLEGEDIVYCGWERSNK